jgi:phospholipid:diacylglycerol acyltransferase
LKWTNPLEVQLPNAPSMKIYCLYGHGKETEVRWFFLPGTTNTIVAADTETQQRSYWYVQGEYEQDESRSDAENDEAFVSELINGLR